MNAKYLLASTLKHIGLFELTRSVMIKLGLHVPVPHGHALLINALNEKAELEGGKLFGYVCIEIGSTREDLPGQSSTLALAEKCNELGVHFITVDMDPSNTASAIETIKRINPAFEAINAKGEDYLAGYTGRLDFLYLDAFDIDHSHHSERRRERYKEILNSDINDEACHAMHLDCASAAVKLMSEQSDIVFDDAWRSENGWAGKGTTAMPLLLSKGFEVKRETKNTVHLRRKAIEP
ncbi:hypothetical protein [Algiphilus sp.]|uniref:hypothetical protein n=1 Tax=Algiphilus sp. TaxID=1872431 RepID=UPI0032ED8BAE